MEKMASDSEASEELKQSNVGRAEESLALLWKDLDERFQSTRDLVQTRFQELQERQKELEEKSMNFNSEMESRAKELHGIEKLIEEKLQQVYEGKNQLHSINSLIQEYNEEIDVKEKRLVEVGKLVGEKEREYELIQNRFKEKTRKLNTAEKTLKHKSKEVESKEWEIKRVKRVLSKFTGDVELKEKQLNAILGSIDVRKKIFELIGDKIKVSKRLIAECHKEMQLKEKKLCSISESVVECSKTLDSKEKMVKEIDMKVKDFCLHKKSMVEWSCKLELKRRELEGWFEKLEQKEKQFESKVEELNLIEKRVYECFNVVQQREKHLDSIEKSVQECSHRLEIKERQLEQQARELELKQKQFKVKIEHSEHIPANNATVPPSTSNQSSINRDGRALQLFMKERLNRINSVGMELAALLQGSPDPANLVLDAMQGFYPSNPTVDSSRFNFELNVIRKSCILLLEELKRMSPQISPLVKEQAMKLAADWKAKMTVATENRLEVLGFLRLLAAYELTSTYDANALQTLLAIVPEHATELCPDLGITDKAPASSAICSPVEIEEPEPSLAKNAATSSSPSVRLTANADARNFQGFLNENLSGNHLTQKITLAALQYSSDPAKLVLDLMQTSFVEYWKKGDVGFKATVMSGYISLLDQLMTVSPHVEPGVKKDAIKIAIQWKQGMGANTENSLELLGFLHFIATYGLLFAFNGDEIAVLLGRISQNKQALELCRTLGLADKISGNSPFETSLEQFDESCNFVLHVAEFIQNLIEMKQVIEAVRLIFTFNLIDKYPPVPLLEAYVAYANSVCREMISLDEKDMVVDYQIAVLRAVIQCVKDYNLESEYPSRGIEIQIVHLEKLKENWRLAAAFLPSNVEKQGQEKGKKRSSNTFASEFQPQQRKNICHRAAVSDAGPHPLPTFTPVYLQSRFLYEISGQTGQFAENNGHPGQFAENHGHHEMGANVGTIQNAAVHNPYQYLPSHHRYGPN